MTPEEKFGPAPKRDEVPLSVSETDAWIDLCVDYGDWVDPATELRQHFTIAEDMPGMKGAEPVAGGLGLSAPQDAREAIARARGDVDIPATLAAHNAWQDLQSDLTTAVEQTRKDAKIITAAALTVVGLAGTAIGFGLSGLLRAVIG